MLRPLFIPVLMLGLLLGACKRLPTPSRSHFPLPEDVETSTNVPGKTGATFVSTSSGEPTSFNPLIIEDSESADISEMMLSGLTTSDPVTQEIIPSLAKSWEISADKKQYLMHLRRGVLWSDGQPLTADDVVFTFQAIFDPRYPNRSSQQFTMGGKPLGFEKLDDFTVRFTTPVLYSPFLNDLGGVGILPKHSLEKSFADGSLSKQWTVETAINRPETIVSSGPFCLISYRPGDRIILAPNPHYWRADTQAQRLPYIDLYVIKYVKDQNADLINFAMGQTESSGVQAADVGWVKQGEKTYGYTIHDQGPASSISFIWFNQNPGKDKNQKTFIPAFKLKWFQDRRFRQAIAYGFNRQGLIESVYFGRAKALHSILSEANLKWHNTNTTRFDYDPQKAASLLAEAGFKKNAEGKLVDSQGNPVDFEIMMPQGSQTAPQIISSFKEDMKVLGINVKISPLDFGTMIARTSQSFTYEAAIMGFTGGGDPSGGKAIYKSDGRLHVWYPSQPKPSTPWEARVDELMDLQEQTFDPLLRKKYIDEMQEIFAVERPLIFLVTPTSYLGLKDKWQNLMKNLRGSLTYRIDEIWAEDKKP